MREISNTLKQAQAMIGHALALERDADIWWFTLDEHYQTYIARAFRRLLDDTKPQYIPRQLWYWWHRRMFNACNFR